MPKLSDNLNYLAYADDTIIFTSTHQESMEKLMNILYEYEEQSRQRINKEKSLFYLH